MSISDYRPKTTAPGPVRVGEVSPERIGNQSGMAALGGAVQETGMVLERAKQELEVNDARAALTDGLGELNAELTRDQDFATMRPRYEQRLGELESSILGNLRTPGQKSRMQGELKRASVGAMANVYRREFELEGSHARATLSRTLRGTANQLPVAGSEEEQSEHYNRAMTAIDDMVEAGYLDPEQAERARLTFDGSVSEALVLDAINTDPRAAAESLSEPDAYNLDEVDRQRYLAQATRIAESQERQGATILERRVDTAANLLVRGRTVNPDDLEQLRQDAEGTPKAQTLEGAIIANGRLGGFYAASPAARAAHIAQLRDSGINLDDASIENAELTALEQIDENAKRDMAKDPVAYAQTAALPGYAPLDLSDQDSVDLRMGLVTELVTQYGAPGKVFTEAEKTHFKTLINDGEVDEQLAVVTSLMDGFKDSAPTVFRELDGIDPVVRRAGELVFETGDDQVARIILAGRKAMDAGDERRVAGEDAIIAFEETMAGAMAAVPGMREEIIESAKAYYAQMAPGRASLNSVSGQTQLLTEGAQRVLGGVQRDGVLYGGIQEVNGRVVRLPSTLDRRSTMRVINEATEDHWKAASLSGNLPHEGEAPRMPSNPVLMWVEGSIYRLGQRTRRSDEPEWFQDPATSNGFFYVDLHRLAEGFMRAPPVKPENDGGADRFERTR